MRTFALWASLLLSSAGCFHYRTWFPEHGAPATQVQRVTTWAFAWGLVQQDVRPANCAANALHESTVSTNFAFGLLTVASLGLVAPAVVEWRCAKPPPGEL